MSKSTSVIIDDAEWEQEFLKREIIDKYSNLIEILQNKIHTELIGSGIKIHRTEQTGGTVTTTIQTTHVPSTPTPPSTPTSPPPSTSKTPAQLLVDAQMNAKEIKDLIQKIKDDFEKSYLLFKKEYLKIVEKGKPQNGDANTTYTELRQTILDIIDKAIGDIYIEFDTCINTIDNNVQLLEVSSVLHNTAILALFYRINSIYANSLVEMIKDIRLDGFSLKGSRNLLREYLNEKIRDLPELKHMSLKGVNKRLKEVNLMLKGIVPRTDSSLVTHSLQKVSVGGFNNIGYSFKKYKRSDLNKLAKKIGLTNPKKFRNKDTLCRILNTVIFFKAGGFRKRKELNQIAHLLSINPNSYKTKKDLLRKLNKTIF